MSDIDLNLMLGVIGVLLGAIALGPQAGFVIAVFVCGVLVGRRSRERR
jgi:hypothetical protein